MAARKKVGAGGKLARSEVVTVRLDPRLRYGVELAARKHRRTASSFIEWAIEHALEMVVIREAEDQYQGSVTAQDVLAQVWDVDEPDRFAKLAIRFPELLSHEEQVLWKLIRECGALWRGHWKQQGDREYFTWESSENYLDFEQLREHWDRFIQIANGDLSPNKLPSWVKERPADDLDIPF
jgi:predicted transcriptional regulator